MPLKWRWGMTWYLETVRLFNPVHSGTQLRPCEFRDRASWAVWWQLDSGRNPGFCFCQPPSVQCHQPQSSGPVVSCWYIAGAMHLVVFGIVHSEGDMWQWMMSQPHTERKSSVFDLDGIGSKRRTSGFSGTYWWLEDHKLVHYAKGEASMTSFSDSIDGWCHFQGKDVVFDHGL